MTKSNNNNNNDKIMNGKLELRDLHVAIKEKEIIKGVSLEFEPGKVYVIMGPNGAGKSTLAHAIMGHPNYTLTKGKIILDGKDITTEKTDERSRRGIFLSFQYPTEIPGIKLTHFLRTIVNNGREKKYSVMEFAKLLEEKLKLLNMDMSFVKRYLNDGFSGGEKKKSEILQMMLLEPKYALLDETDSGLDVDGIKIVAQGINQVRKDNQNLCVIVITHSIKFLDYLQPDVVCVLHQGKVVKKGTIELAKEIEAKGFKDFTG